MVAKFAFFHFTNRQAKPYRTQRVTKACREKTQAGCGDNSSRIERVPCVRVWHRYHNGYCSVEFVSKHQTLVHATAAAVSGIDKNASKRLALLLEGAAAARPPIAAFRCLRPSLSRSKQRRTAVVSATKFFESSVIQVGLVGEYERERKQQQQSKTARD